MGILKYRGLCFTVGPGQEICVTLNEDNTIWHWTNDVTRRDISKVVGNNFVPDKSWEQTLFQKCVIKTIARLIFLKDH